MVVKLVYMDNRGEIFFFSGEISNVNFQMWVSGVAPSNVKMPLYVKGS